MQAPSKKYELTALLGAFALFLSTIEYLIPKPLPFIRLGLANLPILIALYILPPPFTILLIFLKIIGQALVNGTMFSYIFLFSFAGSLTSGFLMLGSRLLFKDRISIIGISILGALTSNLMQVLLAWLLVIGKGAMLIAPPFIGIGLLTSILLGLFARSFCNRSSWFQERLQERV